MKNTLKLGIIAFAFGIFFIGADTTNGQNRENRREARRDYREEVRDARQDRRRASEMERAVVKQIVSFVKKDGTPDVNIVEKPVIASIAVIT